MAAGRPSAPSTTMCSGCQPVAATALPESSRAVKKAWVTNGLSAPAQASQSAAAIPAALVTRRAVAVMACSGRARGQRADLEDDLVYRAGGDGALRRAA